MRVLLIALCLAAPPATGSPLYDDRGQPLPDAATSRIVTLSPHLAELVHQSGAGSKLVGTVAYSDYPAAVMDLPQVGDAFRVDLERLVSLNPDVVIAWMGGNPMTVIEEIERLGIPVVALSTSSLADIARHIRLIGALGGEREVAELVAKQFETRLANIRARHEQLVEVRVFYQISARPLYTIGGRHSLNDAIEICGGRNVFDDLDALAPVVTTEAVLGANPQVITGGVFPFPADDPGALSTWRRWSRIDAVRDNHLYQLDASTMGRPTPRILDGVDMLCERINRARQR